MDGVKQLMGVCEAGDAASVEALLEETDGLQVDATDDIGNTPLAVAAANGHDQVARKLMMRGAAVDKKNLYGWTPVMQAARYGHANIISLILQHQVDVNGFNAYGMSALTVAASGGHLAVVRQLVEAGADIMPQGSSCEYTPVMVAAQHGHDAVLRLLLDRGCDVNQRVPSTGVTPLMLASLNGHMTTAQILIERGGDPNLSNVLEHTALAVAAIRGKREVRGFLERKTTTKTIIEPEERKPDIIEAAKQGNIQRIRDILEVDVSQRDTCSVHDGATPLMFAAMTGRIDIAQLLVERGCDINKQDNISGWTALMQATYHGKKSVAIFLINVGADVSTQAKNGCTAFDMASLIDDVDTELLRLLANKTMHVNKGDKSGLARTWNKQNGSASTMPYTSDQLMDDQPKSGLKGWLNRLSNRFRNLKIGGTFSSKNSNRLVPLTVDGQTESFHDLPIPPSRLSPQLGPKKNNFVMDPVAKSMTSYETMKQETKKSAAHYTLDINPPHLSSDTLKPVIPPFLPPPSFDLDSPSRPWRPSRAKTTMTGLDTPSSLGSGHERPVLRPMKFLQSSSSGYNNQVSPTNSGRFTQASSNPSPNSSGDYQGTGLFMPPPSSYSGSERNAMFSPPTHGSSRLFMPRKSPGFRGMSNTTSPNSSASGTSGTSSSVTPIRSSRGRSCSSKGSTTSTLTPSPSPTPGKFADDAGPLLDSVNEHEAGTGDELSGILKKLSLEKYHPIFEEQEVDMEAFLTLTDDDLTELGISHVESRRQILSEITELNTGKARDRRQFHDTMQSFQTTLKARQSDVASSCSSAGQNWLNPGEIE
ncbi:ANKS6-like protein [Mya arenaria]|uniref:ANKS6-like protein n=1 Tax=Mya arenaria TaxID=6604 RepID=A0ABY7ETP9_MYAAR|nr:ankyrin repeat and SAM domain-containing protein 6-like [Mya arenaria]WAR13333.1 ANKS6-like protein [Mya arenaria]